MEYLSLLLTSFQGIGLILVIVALVPTRDKAPAKDFVFGPIRVSIRRPKLFIAGLLLLGIGQLFEAGEKLLRISRG